MPFGLSDDAHRQRFRKHARPLPKALADLQDAVDKRDCRTAYRHLQAALKLSDSAIEASKGLKSHSTRSVKVTDRIRSMRSKAIESFKPCVIRG